MLPLSDDDLKRLARICREHGVARLDLFGSAATGEFDAARSDLDFIVEFLPGTDLGPWLAKYFDLKQALEDLFGRPVDLVMAGAVRNKPSFAARVEHTRRNLFAA